MENTGIIDRFLDLFGRYIDSGFGLISADVGFLASALIVIDVTLAFLFWTWGGDEDIIARLVKKTLHVGFFAFLITNWNGLAKIIYLSFSGIGLKAAGSGSPEDLLHPGRIAKIGIDAGRPLIEQASDMAGPVGLFTNAADIVVLLIVWAIVLLSFLIIAIQIFVTLIEFKLVTLAGFVLVPFGLFGRTAFLAERVLGNVMATGVKVLVLAIIIGIGSTIFDEFVRDFGGTPPDLEQVASLALAALTLLGLAIFGPGIAAGLISGGPQLGAGSAVATGLVATGAGAAVGMGAAALAGAAGRTGTRAAGALSSRSPAAPRRGGPSAPPAPPAPSGGAPTVPPPSGAPSGGGSAPAGSGGVASTPPPARGGAGGAGGSTAEAPEPEAAPVASVPAPSSAGNPVVPPAPQSDAPAWARQHRRRQAMMQGATMAVHAVRSSDHGSGGAHVSLEDRS